MSQFFRKSLVQNHSGQAVVEYILMITVALFIVGLIGSTFVRVRNYLWMQMACEISSACPHCPPDSDLQGLANRLAPGSCRSPE